MNPIILTNNSKVNLKYKCKFEIYFMEEKSYIEILLEARDMIHKGYKLLTHPMCSSLKPNQTNFRSIILSKNTKGIDIDSVLMIERALENAEKFLKFKKLPNWDPQIIEDFKTVDLSLIEGVVNKPLFL